MLHRYGPWLRTGHRKKGGCWHLYDTHRIGDGRSLEVFQTPTKYVTQTLRATCRIPIAACAIPWWQFFLQSIHEKIGSQCHAILDPTHGRYGVHRCQTMPENAQDCRSKSVAGEHDKHKGAHVEIQLAIGMNGSNRREAIWNNTTACRNKSRYSTILVGEIRTQCIPSEVSWLLSFNIDISAFWLMLTLSSTGCHVCMCRP